MNPKDSVVAYIGLGGNVGDVQERFQRAVCAMHSWPETQVDECSSLYRSAPWGVTDQDDYLNAVVRLRTTLSPTRLHERMTALERAEGRDRDHETRWGPRTLDLDLLLFGDEVIHTDHLTVPHPRMVQRSFVMVPLLELSPDIRIPGHMGVIDNPSQWESSELTRIGDLNCDEH